jgi:hypothetical protein
MQQAARNLLAHRDAGRRCDPLALAWAEQLLKQNPSEKKVPAEDEQRKESA